MNNDNAPTAEPAARGEAGRVFIEETDASGKPTGYLNEMYGTLERSLRQQMEDDGMHGSYPDKLCIKAADAIANLRVALASQIDITNTERGHAERAARLLAAQPRAVPDGWVLVPEIATQTMVDAGSKEWRHQSIFGIWEAMLAAAPSPGESA